MNVRQDHIEQGKTFLGVVLIQNSLWSCRPLEANSHVVCGEYVSWWWMDSILLWHVASSAEHWWSVLLWHTAPHPFFPELCLRETAKSGDGTQGDDGLLYCVTESQHDVPVLLELPGEQRAPIFIFIFYFIWNRYCLYWCSSFLYCQHGGQCYL